MQDFRSEGTNGEAINDALYARNAGVEKRLGVTLEWVGETGNDSNHEKYVKTAENDAGSGDPAYDIYAAYSRTIPLLSMSGVCGNLLDNEYFNVSQPWWPKALTDECTINDCLFFCTGDISTNLLWMMSAIFYNKGLWESANLDKTPEDYVQSNEWTFEKFNEIVKDFYIDDGNGVVDDEDTFGLCGYTACYDAFLNFSGVISVTKNKNGELAVSPDYYGEKGITIVQNYGNLCKNDSVHWGDEQGPERKLFMSGKSLFIVDGTYVVTKVAGDGDDIKYGIVPGPKLNSDQLKYCTNLRYPFNFYAVNKVSVNKDVAGAVIEAQASASYRGVTPVQFEVTMKSRYADNDISAKMYDIVREGIVFDFGRIYGYSLTNFYPEFRKNLFNGGSNWSSVSKATAKKIPNYIKTITKTYTDAK